MTAPSLAYIVDRCGSALDISAISRERFQKFIIVYADKYRKPKDLVKYIIEQRFSSIFFGWRQGLFDIGQDNVLLNKLLDHNISIGFLVADYLGFDFYEKEKQLMSFANYYYVTNFNLYEKYSKLFSSFKPRGIIYDLPDIEAIQAIREKSTKTANHRPKIIWVGNSSWGNRKGKKDHKGFHEVILPLNKLIRNHGNCFDLTIIDSKMNKVSNSEVLQKIYRSDFLLQTSISEGTGLPVLEALGLGVLPLSTNVGIIPELYQGLLSRLIVPREAEKIHELLHLMLLDESIPSEIIRKVYDTHISLSSKITIDPNPYDRRVFHLEKSKKSPSIQLSWHYRYFRVKLDFLKKLFRIIKK